MPSFSDELLQFGPHGTSRRLTESESFEYCEHLARTHYENFSVASFLLPKQLRRPFAVVYSYCRWADDLADEHDGTESAKKLALDLLDWWERELDLCFDAKEAEITIPTHPVFVALRPIIQAFRLHKKPFSDLLRAFRQDQIQHHYYSMNELLEYCRYSANPVGRIVLHLVYGSLNPTIADGKPNDEQLELSDSICTGLQLANFWQDVARDRKIGRSYIPQNVAEQFGLMDDSVSDSPQFRSMMAHLVEDARTRLLAGLPLVNSVPKMVRHDIALFIRGGLAILRAIEKINYDVLHRRPVVSKWTKLCLLVGLPFSR
ncbi:MAG: squalene synthase HpnC [Thermoguttaceae bacterium]